MCKKKHLHPGLLEQLYADTELICMGGFVYLVKLALSYLYPSFL